MPRTAAKADITPVKVNTTALAQANAALDQQSEAVRKIMTSYNITTTDKNVLVAEIRGHMSSTVEMMFNIGARLMLLKSLCTHGEWMPLLEQLGVSHSTAGKIMLATRKFSDPSTGKARDKFLELDRGKLIELIALDDEQVDELEKGELMELDLDEVSRMSHTELRRKVRELKNTVEGKDKLLDKKNKELDRAQEQLANAYTPSEDAVAQTAAEQAAYTALQSAHTELFAAQSRLAVVVRDIQQQGMGEAMELAATTAIQHAAQRMAEVVNESGVAVDFAEMVTPEWLQGAMGDKPRKSKKA